jgi:integrase
MAIRQKGTKFQVDVTVAGKRSPRISCDTMGEARQIEADFKAKMLAGIDPSMLVTTATSAAARKGTLGMAVEVAHRNKWQGRKSEDSSLRNAESWVLELGKDFPLDRLTSDKIGEVCDAWGAAGNKAGTINRKLAALSVMLKLACEDGLITRVPRLPKRKEYEGRLRWFSDDEVDSLLTYAPDRETYNLFVVAVETGLRASGIFKLVKRDIDFDRGLLLLGETKGDRRASVPLTSAATTALKEQTHDKLDHERIWTRRLNTNHTSRVVRGWKRSRGLPDGDEACFHTFRHTTCSRLVQRGVPLPVVQKFMRHADITTTMGYAHLAPDSLDLARIALERNAV